MDGYPASKLAAERSLLAMEGLDVRVLRLPFVYGDGDPHIEEVIPRMRGFVPTQRMDRPPRRRRPGRRACARYSIPFAPNLQRGRRRSPDLAALFASVGAALPGGSNAERGGAFDPLLDGRRIREDLGFKPEFPRLADAIAARALDEGFTPLHPLSVFRTTRGRGGGD